MKIEIKNKWSGALIFECDAESLRVAVELAVSQKVSLSAANLHAADLSGADLSAANLHAADLSGADLSAANLHAADLSAANLSGADLSGADLSGADLSGADLSGADLSDAKNVDDFTMSDGVKFSEYLRSVVPALLTAGGKTLEQIVQSGCWECHSWENCPMAVAFNIKDPSQGPPLLRARIKEFVQFFDARLIPCPTLDGKEKQ